MTDLIFSLKYIFIEFYKKPILPKFEGVPTYLF